MNRLTDVVKNLMIINVIVFVGVTFLVPQFRNYFVLYPVGSSYFQPIQLVTHMFNHGSLNHLFFNMLGLFFIGPIVEQSLGPKRFLFLYLAAGVGSLLLHLVFSGANPVLGASGCLLGVVVAFAVMYPDMEMMLIFLPIPIKAKYLVSAFVIGDLVLGFMGARTGIAHFAHLGGALVGYVLIQVWRKYPDFMR
ncbi:MAG: rhomboid family intramembrane serine protease [Bacteroidota bacterium]